jgi:two-component system sensor histidine kinase BaeS
MSFLRWRFPARLKALSQKFPLQRSSALEDEPTLSPSTEQDEIDGYLADEEDEPEPDDNTPSQWLGLRRPRLHSLRAKFALGYALVALLAVAAISLAAVLAVIINFSHYEGDQLSTQAQALATQIGQRAGNDDLDMRDVAYGFLVPGRDRERSRLWLMDASGRMLISQTSDVDDSPDNEAATVQKALLSALKGQEVRGTIPGGGERLLWFDLSSRPYVAVPIHAGGQPASQIIGALALVIPGAPPGTPIPFIDEVLQVLLLTMVVTALALGLLGALISRTITRPVEQLTLAAAGMAAGNYSQRVTVPTRDEIGDLAHTFNEMAAALERDVGELRRQEALRRELVANVSHDLATPLTAIQGFSEALMDGVIQDEQQREETLRVIAKEVIRLRRLVDSLNHLTRIESPNRQLALAPLQLSALVDETLTVLQPELEEKGVQAHNHLSQKTPLVLADSDKITQVFLNLLDNALRYTPTGGSISISARPEGDYVRVTVRDTGSGIAAEDAPRIFDRFYRSDASRNTATGNSGLGLSIVKAIVEAHGGTVGVESALGQGTTIWFTLAQARSTDHAK